MRLFFYGLSIGVQAATLALLSGAFEDLFGVVRADPPPFVFWSFRFSVFLMFAGPIFFWLVVPFIRHGRQAGAEG